MDYQILSIKFSDLPQAIIKQAEKERITFINKIGSLFWAAVVNDEIIGITAVYIAKNGHAKLKSSWVKKEFRGNGIFNALHQTRLKILVQFGVKKISVNCTDFSKGTHTRYGAMITGTTKTITYMEYDIKEVQNAVLRNFQQ